MLAAVGAGSSLLLISFLVGVAAAFLAYGSARRYEARTGVAAWHMPAGAWAFIFFLSWLLGLILFTIAKATTKRRGPLPADDRQVTPLLGTEPAPIAGWYPDPSGRHELRYWDGKGWTSHVRDGANQATDAG